MISSCECLNKSSFLELGALFIQKQQFKLEIEVDDLKINLDEESKYGKINLKAKLWRNKKKGVKYDDEI